MATTKYELEGFALIVVDMINAYLREGQPQYSKECREIIPHVRSLLNFFRANRGLVVFSNTMLETQHDPMAIKWGLHARKGTSECRTISELRPRSGEKVCGKKSYNGFFRTKLGQLLSSNHIHTVVICGIHTHACVLLTAAGALDHGFSTIVIEDCVTTSYKPNHTSRLRFFNSHIGALMTSAAFNTFVTGQTTQAANRRGTSTRENLNAAIEPST